MKTFFENAKFYHQESTKLTFSLNDDDMNAEKVAETFSLLGHLQGSFGALLCLAEENPGLRFDLQERYEAGIPKAKAFAKKMLGK